MIVVDVNLLLYAVNSDSARHVPARQWWEEQLSNDVPVGVAWTVLLGFLRLTTNPRVLPRPISVEEAVAVVDDWLGQPSVRLLEPTERHWPISRRLLHALGSGGNLTSDAHLAALAIEHGATLCSADNDFERFPLLRWMNPLA